jgi:hypothetical protein
VSAVPTENDALAMLTDPSLRTAAPVDDGHQQMDSAEIIDRLCERGMDPIDARVLVGRALRQLGGSNRSGSPGWGLGRRRSVLVEDYWVPASVFR